MFFDINGFGRHAAMPTAEPAALVADGIPPIKALTANERSTVIVSLRDRRSSLGSELRFFRMVRFIFGIERPNGMADPRLEALRRFSIVSRLDGDRIADAEIHAFLEAGFAPDQMDAVRRLILEAQPDTARAQ